MQKKCRDELNERKVEHKMQREIGNTFFAHFTFHAFFNRTRYKVYVHTSFTYFLNEKSLFDLDTIRSIYFQKKWFFETIDARLEKQKWAFKNVLVMIKRNE